MDRCAVFIDAGYLLAEGGRITCGTTSRASFECNYSGLVTGLSRWIAEHSSGLATLRTYWYDGAARGIPTADHERIGGLAYVKVRLGRVIQGQQKGVDALIYRDLMTLARERAITTAYLVSGDEDLREGVVAAQDMGVQVVLIGIPTRQRTNQSATLIREADEHVVLPVEFWQPFFSTPQQDSPPPDIEAGPTEAQVAGRAFAVAWLEGADDASVTALIAAEPVIPRELDIQMIIEAEKTLGSLRERQDLKRELRGAFWAVVKEGRKRPAAGE